MSGIMIVDDEESILKSLQRLLRHVPCSHGNKTFQLDVCVQNERLKALELVRHEPFDLFISEYSMPLMDGVEFLKAVKEVQPDAARLILSGYANLNAMLRAVNEVSIDSFIGKPWNDFELNAAIAQSLAHRELANLVRMEMGDTDPQQLEAERLEAIEPGITQVNWGPDGSVILDPEFQRPH